MMQAARSRTGVLHRRWKDERGMSLVFVGVGFMGFIAATALAIDLGMLMTARNQVQNAADAGAHAGAVALAFDDFNDRSPSGPAATNAIARATENLVIGAPPDVQPGDVQFFQNEDGLWNQVQVTAYRNAARGNPLPTFIAQLFGVDTMDIQATARAEASPANAADCVLPFAIPDRWEEVTEPPFDPMTSTYDYYAGKNGGRPLANPDLYYPPTDRDTYRGYNPDTDKGTQIRLKASGGTNVSPSIYFPIVVPGNGSGADEYRYAIANCVHADFVIGADLTVEPGNMVGPTRQGIEDLIAKDPDAYWDEDRNCPARNNQCIASSPRIRPIPLYDPYHYETGKQTGRNADFRIANLIGVFVEGMQGNDVVARITPIIGKRNAGGSPAPEAAFPWVIRIIR